MTDQVEPAKTGTKKRSTEDWQGSRQYVWRGKAYPSVTTIIGAGVPKQKFLVPWAAKTVAEWVVENQDEVRRLLEGDPRIAISTIKDAQYRKKEDAGDRGSAIHAMAEDLAAGKPLPEKPEPGMEGLVGALRDYVRDQGPRFLFSEVSVYSLRHGYAGTLDGIHLWTLNGNRTMLIDWKTGKRAYPEVALQLAALAHADFWDDDGKEAPLPHIDGAAVVHLGDAGYQLREVDIGEDTFKAFRAARLVGDFTAKGDRVFLT